MHACRSQFVGLVLIAGPRSINGPPKAVKRRPKKPGHAGDTLHFAIVFLAEDSSARQCSRRKLHKCSLQTSAIYLCAPVSLQLSGRKSACLQDLFQDKRDGNTPLLGRIGAAAVKLRTAVMMKEPRGTRRVRNTTQSPLQTVFASLDHVLTSSTHPPVRSADTSIVGHLLAVWTCRRVPSCASWGYVQERPVQGHQKAGLGSLLHCVAC